MWIDYKSEKRERNAEALRLKRTGATYREVAQRLGISKERTRQIVIRELEREKSLREMHEAAREMLVQDNPFNPFK